VTGLQNDPSGLDGVIVTVGILNVGAEGGVSPVLEEANEEDVLVDEGGDGKSSARGVACESWL